MHSLHISPASWLLHPTRQPLRFPSLGFYTGHGFTRRYAAAPPGAVSPPRLGRRRERVGHPRAREVRAGGDFFGERNGKEGEGRRRGTCVFLHVPPIE